MPAVYANDIQSNINSFIMRPITPVDSGITTMSPGTPLKPCIKSHARAHSAARKRRVSISETADVASSSDKHVETVPHVGPRVIKHTGIADNEWAATEPRRVVHHNDGGPTGSMFSVLSSNPDYEPDQSKQSHHYTPFHPPPKKIVESIKLKLDNRVMSLHQAFQQLDTTNCGFVTQNELLNACWYWGIKIDPQDLAALANEYYSVLQLSYSDYLDNDKIIL